jgi:carbamoyltransferase
MSNSKPSKYYIGLSANFHDGAIALVNEEGILVFAEATERYLQNKRALNTATDQLFYVEKILTKYPMNDYELAINWTQFDQFIKYTLSASVVYASNKFIRLMRLFGRIININGDELGSYTNYFLSSFFASRTMAGSSFRLQLFARFGLPQKAATNFDHHLCHAYHGYFVSSYTKATILVLDGGGDNGRSLSIYTAEGQNIKRVHKNGQRASLGHYYDLLTHLCGFNIMAGEEWKVMGMAPYGNINEELLNDLKEWIYTSGVSLKTKNKKGIFGIGEKVKKKSYGVLTKFDIARTGQFYYETMVTQLINAIYEKWPNQNLILTGGCALNSAYNGKIHIETRYKNVHVSSAPADDGSAAGAALLNFKKHNPEKRIPHEQSNPYLGFEVDEEELLKMKQYSGYENKKMNYSDLYKYIATEIQAGKIIAWVQGRAEFGPRALGNRSILANPALERMKDKINMHVKYREEFRPFAPAILEEKADEYFENYHPTPYMERVLKIKEDKRSVLKAVNHVDNTGRLQTVTKESNTHFYNLINEFYMLSDVPVLLNTSFNVMGKPIVNSVSDMAAVFATSGIDILVIGQYVFNKN